MLLMQKLSEIPGLKTKILLWIHNFLKTVSSAHSDSVLNIMSHQASHKVPSFIHIDFHPVSLVAGDTLIYQTVNSMKDKTWLQAIIDSLQFWAFK